MIHLCPHCHKQLQKGEKGNFCPCGFYIPYVYRDYRLGDSLIKQLLSDKKSDWLPYWRQKNGNGNFIGRLLLTSDFKIKMEAKKVNFGTCPFCSSDLFYFEKGLFCGSCDFKLWNEIAGRKISSHEMMQLITYKKTEMLTRFVNSESGKFFNAVLQLNSRGLIEFK